VLRRTARISKRGRLQSYTIARESGTALTLVTLLSF
jgi:hypothetical protein